MHFELLEIFFFLKSDVLNVLTMTLMPLWPILSGAESLNELALGEFMG